VSADSRSPFLGFEFALMSKQPNSKLTARVERAAGKVLARDSMITYPELFIEMGILDRRDLEQWYKGRVPYLERVIQSNLTKLARIQTAIRMYGREHGLKRSLRGAKRGRRYSKTGCPFVEEEYHACYGRFISRKKREKG
jgi:hypothetical protein